MYKSYSKFKHNNYKKSNYKHNRNKYSRNSTGNQNTQSIFIKRDDDILNKLTKFYLTAENIKNIDKKYSKYIKTTQPKQEPIKKITEHKKKEESLYYIPKFDDKLLWCWMRFHYGVVNTEFVSQSGFKEEQKEKIRLIQLFKDNKTKIKQLKGLSSFNKLLENLNGEKMNIEVLYALLYVYDYNLCYISKNMYYIGENTGQKTCYILKPNENEGSYRLYNNVDETTIHNITQKKIEIKNLRKPLETITKYKVDDLKKMCDTLNISYINKETGKSIKKKDIYMALQEVLY